MEKIKQENDSKITLSDYFGKIIVTRNAIINFFNILKGITGEKIILDFNNIEFVSRSCAEEYIKRKLAPHKNTKEINLSKNVLAMFFLVARQNSLDAKIITH